MFTNHAALTLDGQLQTGPALSCLIAVLQVDLKSKCIILTPDLFLKCGVRINLWDFPFNHKVVRDDDEGDDDDNVN